MPVAASGPAASFEEIVLPHLDSAYGLARWLLRDPGQAEDVVQDAAVRALTYFASFRGGDGRAWFLQIVRNVAHGALASRGREAARSAGPTGLDGGPAEGVADPASSPEAALSRRQEIGALEAGLAALPVELRECLVLRELEEMSYKEIAAVTGAPIGTVMSRLWRARRTLMAGLSSGGSPAAVDPSAGAGSPASAGSPAREGA